MRQYERSITRVKLYIHLTKDLFYFQNSNFNFGSQSKLGMILDKNVGHKLRNLTEKTKALEKRIKKNLIFNT